MSELNSKERISRILNRQPVDRVGVFECFWEETPKKWQDENKLRSDETPEDHFGLDIRTWWPFNWVADLDFGQQIIEETEETKLVRDGNGALLRWWKNKSGTPEHVDFAVKERHAWDEKVKPKLTDSNVYNKRIDFEGYRQMRRKCQSEELFFCWSGINVFESIHPVCGHEHMLIGMALDPEWVVDMCHVYAELIINLMETLFAAEGKPDGVWFYEDMGFKGRPFMSAAMYKDIIWPAHKKTFDYVHSLGIPIIVHSCGFVESLVPGLIEAGMDCLQAMEVKAGMDLLRLKKQFGNEIAFMGGLDVRPLVSNDRQAIRDELERKLPGAMKASGYVFHSDHSIPAQVEYETYRYFLELGKEMGTYCSSSRVV